MSEKIKVLYAEDEQDIRENIVEILKDEGFEVFEASNGREAVEVFLENEPDVVVSDIMMPEVSGHEFLKIVRENKSIKNNNVPFIFLTALGQKEDVVKGVDLKANDYLTKPIDFELLIAKIKEKYNNYKQIQDSHSKNIQGIKNQVSGMVPSELRKYLEQIKKISKTLKTEPYGPLPHRRYLENINTIYMNSIKMQSLIDNFISGDAIESTITANEDIISPASLIKEFLESIDETISQKVELNEVATQNLVKIDQKLITDVIRRLFGAIYKIDKNSNIEISIIEDHLDQIAIIFYPSSKDISGSNLSNSVNREKINNYIEKQGYHFEIIDKDGEISVVIYIPSYRVVKKDS